MSETRSTSVSIERHVCQSYEGHAPVTAPASYQAITVVQNSIGVILIFDKHIDQSSIGEIAI